MEVGINLAIENLKVCVKKSVKESGLPSYVSYLVLKELTAELEKEKITDLYNESVQYQEEIKKNTKKQAKAAGGD